MSPARQSAPQTLSVLVLALTVVIGCGQTAETEEGYSGPVNRCQGRGDCGVGEICDPVLLLCAVPGKAGGRAYTVNVVPPSASGIPAQLFKVTLGNDGQVNEPLIIYQLASPVIEQVTTADGQKIRARVLFTETGTALPGGPGRVTAILAVENRKFRVQLVPGFSRYSIKVMPEGEASGNYPAVYFDNVEATGTGGLLRADGSRLNLQVEPARYLVGGVVQRAGTSIDQLSVQALDPANGRVISTPATTGCPVTAGNAGASKGTAVCGDFEFGLPAGASRFSLRIERAGDPWYPAVTVPGFEIVAAPDPLNPTEPIRVDLGTVDLGDPLGPPVRYRAMVLEQVTLENGDTVMAGVAGAELFFESDDIAGGRVFQRGYTNERGAVADSPDQEGVDLFAGAYTMIIVPAPPFNDSVDGSAVYVTSDPIQVAAGPRDEPPTFLLTKRPRVVGRVMGGETPVRSAYVTATPTGEKVDFMRNSAASVERDGYFALRPDRTPYLLIAEVPVSSGYAYGVIDLDVPATCPAESPGDCPMDIPLSTPVIAGVELILRDASRMEDQPLAGALVEWYASRDDHRAFLVGRSFSDEQGRVTALLPTLP